MNTFTDLINQTYKDLILEQTPPDPSMAPPADPSMVPPDPSMAPPADPNAAPPADPSASAPQQKSPDKVITNLSLVSTDSFSDWVDSASGGVDTTDKKRIKDLYKKIYDFMQLYKQVKKIVKNINSPTGSDQSTSQGAPPIENTTL